MFRQKRPEPERRPQRPLPWPGQCPVPYRQLVLFDAERDLTAGRRAGFPAPPLPGLAAALEDAPIRATDVEALTQLAFNNVRPVTEILTAAGMLEEDRESALHAGAGEGHQSLREITRQDILSALPAQANQHRQALSALRSLFRFLKGRRIIFADPAARLRHDRLHTGQPLPLNRELSSPRAASSGTRTWCSPSCAGR